MLKVSLNSFLTNQAIIYIGFWSEFRSTEKNLETGELARVFALFAVAFAIYIFGYSTLLRIKCSC